MAASDSSPRVARIETDRLADQLERAFRGGAWHGPALEQALAGVTAAAAARRPLPDSHGIWEIVLHVTAWIDVARQRISGHAVGNLPEAQDWPVPVAPSEAAWQEVLATLDQAHRALQETVAGLTDEQLDAPVAGSDPSVRGMLLGVLQHNVYHAGQIALLKKWGGDPGRRP